ncbi:MAG: DUF4328 domain-containing protein [Dehalococcoidia bacterium]|nr:DUF4328 domain-containing protein [Dehalococcoidia bacterium]
MSQIKSTVPFASGSARAKVLTILLVFGILFDCVAVLLGYLETGLLSRIMAGYEATLEEIDANHVRMGVIGLLQLLVFIATAFLFLMWFHRVHCNLPSFGARDLQYSPRWAVGGFFIPIINLTWPYRIAREIWKASDPAIDASDGLAWKKASPSPLLGTWWTFWIISSLYGRIMVRSFRGADSLEELLNVSWMTLAADILSVLTGVLAVLVVRAIASRQDEKCRRLAVAGMLPGISAQIRA